MAILTHPVVLALLKSKLFLGISGVAILGGGVVTPVVLSATSIARNSKENLEGLRGKTFFTKDKLRKVIDEYKKTQRDAPPSLEQQPSFSGEQEIAEFLTVSKLLVDNDSLTGEDKSINLSQVQKKSISIFCQLYASAERTKASQEVYSSQSDSSQSFESSIACDDLNVLNGEELNWNPVKNNSRENNWGGGEGDKNPFRHFYRENKNSGEEKMQKLAEAFADNSTVLGEIEYDIVFGLMKDMTRIHEKYLSN